VHKKKREERRERRCAFRNGSGVDLQKSGNKLTYAHRVEFRTTSEGAGGREEKNMVGQVQIKGRGSHKGFAKIRGGLVPSRGVASIIVKEDGGRNSGKGIDW